MAQADQSRGSARLGRRRDYLHRGGIQGEGEADLAKGAALADPTALFNSSLEGNTRRAIDFPEGAKIDEKAFKALIREAIALNTSAKRPAKKA